VECFAVVEGEHLRTLRAKNGNFRERRHSGGVDLPVNNFFLRTAPAKPANPVPNNAKVPGSGTVLIIVLPLPRVPYTWENSFEPTTA